MHYRGRPQDNVELSSGSAAHILPSVCAKSRGWLATARGDRAKPNRRRLPVRFRAEIVRNRIGEGFQFVVGGFQLSGAFLNAFLQLRVDRAHFLLRAFARPLLSVPLHPGFEDRRQVPGDALQRLQIALAVIRRFVGDSKKSDRFLLKKDGHCENPADGSAARGGWFWFVGIQRSPFSKRASPDANPLAAPEANSLAGNLAILPSLPRPDREHQRAL